MLNVQNLSFGYGKENDIFENISFSVSDAEIIAIVGPSGTGKSTLLKCIAGLLQPSAGRIDLKDRKVYGIDEVLLAGHEEIAIVNQDFSLDLYHTVEENIRNIILNLDFDARDEFVEELIDLVDLESVRKSQAITLSGGEQQRLSLARALAKEPQLLLMDEPFSHLDIHLRRRVGKFIRQLSSIRKMTVILVTHEGEEALSWADKIYFFNDKQLVLKGKPEEVYTNPKNLFEASFFGEVSEVKLESGQDVLIRPTEYVLEETNGYEEISLEFIEADFRGSYFANYFKATNNKRVVLYNPKKLTNIKVCYVRTKEA